MLFFNEAYVFRVPAEKYLVLISVHETSIFSDGKSFFCGRKGIFVYAVHPRGRGKRDKQGPHQERSELLDGVIYFSPRDPGSKRKVSL